MPSCFAMSVNRPAVVAEEPVQIAVLIRHERVEVAVALHVEPGDADRLARIVDADLPADVDVLAAVVAVEHVRPIAKRDEQVGIAVVVVIEERRLPRRRDDVDAHLPPDVHEALAAVVPVQPVRHGRGTRKADEQIGIPVVVVVAPRRDARLVEVGEADLGRDVDEGAVVVAIEAVHLAAESDEQVEVAVAVEVGPGIRLAALEREELPAAPARRAIRRRRCRRREERRRPSVAALLGEADVADRLQPQAVRGHFFDFRAAERQREILAFSPVRRSGPCSAG